MIGLNEVLYRELPVGFDIKTQSAAQTKRVKVVISDFFKHRGDVRRKRPRVSRDIDEYPVVPGVAGNLNELVVCALRGFRIVLISTKKMRSGEEFALRL